ncbi:magnesium transporter, partial [Mesorhizobium sp. M00.F.Ca.ET.186.01.1.1]
RISDSTETFRDLVNGALDTYYTIISAKTTETMRVLTIISTIILPLTFITGLFGMNTFAWLGEEAEPYMLIVALVIMLAMTFFMLHIFRKRKWL